MIQALVLLVVLGLILYLIENFLPLHPAIKLTIQALAVLIIIIYLLRYFGIA